VRRAHLPIRRLVGRRSSSNSIAFTAVYSPFTARLRPLAAISWKANMFVGNGG
jgi:hypothetical protein